jgi:hypothetical protein
MRKCILQFTVKLFYRLLTLGLRSGKFTFLDSTPPVDIGTPDWGNQPPKHPIPIAIGRGAKRNAHFNLEEKVKVKVPRMLELGGRCLGD